MDLQHGAGACTRAGEWGAVETLLEEMDLDLGGPVRVGDGRGPRGSHVEGGGGGVGAPRHGVGSGGVSGGAEGEEQQQEKSL